MGIKLTSKDHEKLLQKQLANIIRKLNSGKTLTSREEAILAQARINASPAGQSAFAKTWDELAQRLGVSRKSLQNWRSSPVLKPFIPRPRADGRHDVAAWARMMADQCLAKADERIEDPPVDKNEPQAEIIKPPPIAGSQADWNKASSQIIFETKRRKLQVLDGTLLVAAELEVPLGATLAAIQTKMAQFPSRVARFVAGLRDVEEVEERLRDEMDAEISDLHAARYLEISLLEAVQAVPFDEETHRLLSLVIFEGQDRKALMELITHVAREALRRLGQRMITEVHEETKIDEDVEFQTSGIEHTESPVVKETKPKKSQIIPAAATGEADAMIHGNPPRKTKR